VYSRLAADEVLEVAVDVAGTVITRPARQDSTQLVGSVECSEEGVKGCSSQNDLRRSTPYFRVATRGQDQWDSLVWPADELALPPDIARATFMIAIA
jgi:hypothetical protein